MGDVGERTHMLLLALRLMLADALVGLATRALALNAAVEYALRTLALACALQAQIDVAARV